MPEARAGAFADAVVHAATRTLDTDSDTDDDMPGLSSLSVPSGTDSDTSAAVNNDPTWANQAQLVHAPQLVHAAGACDRDTPKSLVTSSLVTSSMRSAFARPRWPGNPAVLRRPAAEATSWVESWHASLRLSHAGVGNELCLFRI
jgi:hypothetical protein